MQRNIDSLEKQTDPDYEHIQIVDEIGVGFYKADGLFVGHRDRIRGRYALILDDDDYLVHDLLIEDLKQISEAEQPDVMMVKMRGPYGILPDKDSWGKRPALNRVGAPNYAVKSTLWKEFIEFFDTGDGCGDFHFIDRIFKSGAKFFWHDVIAVEVPKRGWGKPEK